VSRLRSLRALITTGFVLAAMLSTAAIVALRTAPPASAPAVVMAAAAEDAVGRMLFEGQQPLRGRISGHTQWLPSEALACANCHRAKPGAPGRPAAGGRDTGPVLDATALLERVERRGGPPSRYDLDAFCRVLRLGEDPAGVLLPRVMPRYDLDAGQCEALWRFLTIGQT
jgi:hypothetical protein